MGYDYFFCSLVWKGGEERKRDRCINITWYNYLITDILGMKATIT